jgi:hypothetical protein
LLSVVVVGRGKFKKWPFHVAAVEGEHGDSSGGGPCRLKLAIAQSERSLTNRNSNSGNDDDNNNDNNNSNNIRASSPVCRWSGCEAAS